MLEKELSALEQRCQEEAPTLVGDVRKLIELASKPAPTLAYSLLGEPVTLAAPEKSKPSDGGSPVRVETDAPTLGTLIAGDRYVELGRLGWGGMGEVRRVLDRELNRVVAMKMVHAEVAASRMSLARFVAEVQTTAQLQHPGIVPVYDAGQLHDGRIYYTMKEVKGLTFGEVIDEVHSITPEGFEPPPSRWTFRRLVAALHQATLAVAYAHERGVIHRDLKPANLMVGDFGEVLVLDWGLCKVIGRPDLPAPEQVIETPRDATRMGHVLGTPAYMAPEQATGVAHVDARADVYALGAVLYEVLCGRAPYDGPDGVTVLRKVLEGPPPRPSRTGSDERRTPADAKEAMEHGGPSASELEQSAVDPPEELVQVCLRAMARDPDDRYATAGELASELEAWLEGSRRRDQALELLARAESLKPEVDALRKDAAKLADEAETELSELPGWVPEEAKLAAWAKKDQAATIALQASMKELERDRLLASALIHSPTLPEAHAILAEDHAARLTAADTERDAEGAARAEALLRAHADALPEMHPVRSRSRALLEGTGALTLVTTLEAEVELFRIVTHGRRLVAEPLRSLGRTPIFELPLASGSYLCRIRHPERAEVLYPVHIARGHHWAGARPGAQAPLTIDLPARDALSGDECYVPAGWFRAGGRAEHAAVPPSELWCDAFVMRRFPVTHREYIAFLDDLVRAGREEEAMAYVPRERTGPQDERGTMVYARDQRGGFVLRSEPGREGLGLDVPVTFVDWHCATAYAAWLTARSGLQWRLPWDLEWEKAARGVDGRAMPWGDGFDPSFCNMRESRPGRPEPSPVHAYPHDESVFGVRGLGGNVMDWCHDVWTRRGAENAHRVVAPHEPSADSQRVRRVLRGGHCFGDAAVVRSANRHGDDPRDRDAYLGFRLARSWPG
jgi:serine/threonine-protein kinase